MAYTVYERIFNTQNSVVLGLSLDIFLNFIPESKDEVCESHSWNGVYRNYLLASEQSASETTLRIEGLKDVRVFRSL